MRHIGGATKVVAYRDWREHEAAVPLGYFLFELVVERCNIHIALVELAIEFCRFQHIRGAMRVIAGTVGDSTKWWFDWSTLYLNWLLNGAIYTLLELSW